MPSNKVLDTYMLTMLNRRSTNKAYNRTLSTEQLNTLDPDGWHVIDGTPLDHNDGEHLRCSVLLKIKGEEKPVFAILDIAYADYAVIPIYTDEEEN